MNKKVNRMLEAMAVVLKDEDENLINKLNEVINDNRDGYKFDLKVACNNYKVFVKGRSFVMKLKN